MLDKHLGSRETNLKQPPSQMTALEIEAMIRVRRARVGAPESAIRSWVRSIGPESVLSAKLCDIRAVANAF